MAYRIDDPYNQGIGTPYLGDMNLGQVPVNNMQVAEAINYGVLPGATEAFTPEWQSGATSNLGVKEWMKQNPNPTRGDFIDAIQSGTFGAATPGAFKENVGGLFEGVNLDQSWNPLDATPSLIGTNDATWRQSIDIDKDALEQEALDALPEGFWKDDDQASLDDDFYNEYGYPKTAGLGVLTGLKKIFGPKVGAFLFKAGKNKVLKEGGKKVGPVITGVLTGGAAQAAPGGYTGPKTYGFDEGAHRRSGGNRPDKPGGFTDPGKDSYGPHKAYGGRVSYFDGGLLSLWPR